MKIRYGNGFEEFETLIKTEKSVLIRVKKNTPEVNAFWLSKDNLKSRII